MKLLQKMYLRKKILDHYKDAINPEIKDMLNFIKRLNFLSISLISLMFPYDFSKNYKKKKCKVFFDEKLLMHYVYHGDKKLYFPKEMIPRRIKRYYRIICLEQNPNSPHCYIGNDFNVNNGGICLDIGAAEGCFALDVVEQASKIFLIESESKWIEALEATFAPWKNKIEIIKKFVSDKDDNQNIKLDTFFGNAIKETTIFIKIDAEGMEEKILKGSVNFINQNKTKISVAAYHTSDAEKRLTAFLNNNKFKVITTGYMFLFNEPNPNQFLRRGLIRAQNY